MTRITFERYMRDSQHNHEAKAKGERLTYDFSVIIDGERRAVMHRGLHAGYDLMTLDWERLAVVGRNFHQSDFEQVTRDALEADIIPTPARYIERKAERAAKLAAMVDDWKRKALERRYAEHGAAMLEQLKKAVEIAEEAREEWDKAPQGMRPGKLLVALAGHCMGYRADIKAIHDLIAAMSEPAPEPDDYQRDCFRHDIAREGKGHD